MFKSQTVQNCFILFLSMLKMNSWDIISQVQIVGTKYLLPTVKHTLNMVELGGWAVGDFCSLLLSWWETDSNSNSLMGMTGGLEACPWLWGPGRSRPPREDPGSEWQKAPAGLTRGSSQAPQGTPFTHPAHRGSHSATGVEKVACALPVAGQCQGGSAAGGGGSASRSGSGTHFLCSLWYFHRVLGGPPPGPCPAATGPLQQMVAAASGSRSCDTLPLPEHPPGRWAFSSPAREGLITAPSRGSSWPA